MENFKKNFDVSCETFNNLQCYVALLNEWQQKFNLVSKNSLPEVWTRHIADSAQLYKFLDDDVNLVYDFGSGAGFPALVLAIMAKEKNPHIRFKLVESITKKTLYLNTVKDKIKLDNVEVFNNRVEKLNLPKADVITARAMTALENLFEYAFMFADKHTKMIFPKGKTFEDELNKAKQKWNFKYTIYPNEFCDDGVVLIIENLRRKK